MSTHASHDPEEEWLNLPTDQWLATTLAYDLFGNVHTVTDALGRSTTNTYDADGTVLLRKTGAGLNSVAYPEESWLAHPVTCWMEAVTT